MFGESESESPRVPSPWDHLISSRSPSRSPPSYTSSPKHSGSPYLQPVQAVAQTILPRLVPEADSGNVEYKLQLLSPSPARFARLVTQLKWRLLEGGGQAYYELGVADSGALVGLNRAEMEASLETLEMMAGEIGASVVVVKEIEVPGEMVKAVKAQQEAGVDLNWVGEEKWGRSKRRGLVEGEAEGGDTEGDETTTTTTTDSTAAETTDAEAEEDGEDLSATVMLHRPAITTLNPRSQSSSSSSGSVSIFTMDPEPDMDPADHADGEQDPEGLEIPSIVIDLEISSVFKPRPVRTKVHSAHLMNLAGRNKRQKKMFKSPFKLGEKNGPILTDGSAHEDGLAGEMGKKRQGRDKKRAAVNETMESSPVTGALSPLPPASAVLATAEEVRTDTLVSDLASLHVSVEDTVLPAPALGGTPDYAAKHRTTIRQEVPEGESFAIDKLDASEDVEDDDDVFPTVLSARGEEKVKEDIAQANGFEGKVEDGKRIIVEALVVRKMSWEEAFLDFGTFAN